MGIFSIFKCKKQDAAIRIKPGVRYMCFKDILPYVAGEIYLGADIDPKIKQWYKYFREATPEEIAQWERDHQPPTPPEPEPEPEPEPDPVPTLAEDVLRGVLSRFASVMSIGTGSLTYEWLCRVVTEAYRQYFRSESGEGFPLLYRRELMPTVVDYYGERKDEQAAFTTQVGWIVALHLSELCPMKRNQLFPIGYETGGYDAETPLYGWQFRSDPNVARIIGGALLAAMEGKCEPDIAAMRQEVGGKAYDRTLAEIVDQESRYNVADDGFYIDFRKFLVSAPGPYAPGYQNRKNLRPTFTDEKTANGCLAMDMEIHEQIVGSLNLPDQQAVQAVADKEWDERHLYGDDMHGVGGRYDFNAVFGLSTIGIRIDPEDELAVWIANAKTAGSSARGILQHANTAYGPMEYGRLRPGCSWEREAAKHSTTDDRQNVLADFVIEDGDGCPTGYYDAHGNWVKPAECHSPEQYKDIQQTQLYANSFPSGHSGGIICATMFWIKRYPLLADLLLRAAIAFSLNRTIARYHWTSDVITGRIVGSAMYAICRATKK